MSVKWITFILATVVGLGTGCNGMNGTGTDMGTSGNHDLRMSTTGDGGVSDMTMVTEDQACALQSQAVCSLLSRCAPFSFLADYLDMTSCVARFQLTCAGASTLTGSKTTPADIAACGNAIAAESCADYYTGTDPAACKVPGAVAGGGACGSGLQCASMSCSAGISCGTCRSALAAEGASCGGQTVCDFGLYCSQTTLKCARFVAMGGACNVNTNVLCVPTLTCQNGACATPLGQGASCNAARDYNGGCDRNQGLSCPSGANAKCTATPTAPAGQACPSGTACINGSYCFAGRCVAPVADGATCSDTNGPPCLANAYCIASKCTVFNPSTCH